LLTLSLQEKKEEEENEEEQKEETETDDDDDKIIDQDLLGAIYACLGQTWPKNNSNTQGT
jgi:predicted RNA polymerase sigma factor